MKQVKTNKPGVGLNINTALPFAKKLMSQSNLILTDALELVLKASRDLPAMAVEIDEDLLFKKLFPNTEMAVDVKIYADKPGRMAVGDTIAATVTRDGEDHFTILQLALEKMMQHASRSKPKVKRNPIILPGTYINVHEAEDGTRYPAFNRPEYTDDFTFYDFCLGAAQELLAVAGLVGKGLSTK